MQTAVRPRTISSSVPATSTCHFVRQLQWYGHHPRTGVVSQTPDFHLPQVFGGLPSDFTCWRYDTAVKVMFNQNPVRKRRKQKRNEWERVIYTHAKDFSLIHIMGMHHHIEGSGTTYPSRMQLGGQRLGLWPCPIRASSLAPRPTATELHGTVGWLGKLQCHQVMCY